MKERTPVNPGTVDWAGENPGIYLKSSPNGDYISLGLFFRIVLSPHGRGHTMLILGAPDEAKGYPDVPNLCLTDNEELTQYLMEDFVSKFPTFSGKPGLGAASWLPITSIEKSGDLKSIYTEHIVSNEVEAKMSWLDLNPPFAVEVSPSHSVTGAHDMYSVFLVAKNAMITVDGKRLPGAVADRELFGQPISSAFLAFAETWVTPSS